MNDSLRKVNEKYKNFIVIGDFNIDIGLSFDEYEKVEHISTLFNLQSLINKETCFTLLITLKVDSRVGWPGSF